MIAIPYVHKVSSPYKRSRISVPFVMICQSKERHPIIILLDELIAQVMKISFDWYFVAPVVKSISNKADRITPASF